MHPSTYIIVPVYNEASVVRDTVDELCKCFDHVVCVDDGSTDGSIHSLARSCASVVVHPINLGQGAALQTGIDAALRDPSARYFITFDADGQHRVEDALAMLGLLESKEVDIVFGSRFVDSGEGPRGLRRMMLRAGTWFTNASYRVHLTDTHNGLRAFNRRFAETLSIEVNDMGHASEIISQAAHGSFRIAESPTRVLYTDYSLAKGQSLMNGVNIALDILLSAVTKERPR